MSVSYDVSGQDGKASSPEAQSQVKKKKKLLNGNNITFNYPSGSKYVGSFRDGKLQGYGIYSYHPSGDTYEGEWKADLKHGHGTYYYANGDRYIGEWFMGKKHGKGRFIFATGDEYSGAWREDKMDGYGVFKLVSNGNRYEGYWKEGTRQGMGILFFGNGDVYDGEWDGGKENGLGILSQTNEDTYCGGWKDGVMDGKGLLREKGILYYVEYMGGYVISKIAADGDAAADTDVEYNKAQRRYEEWEKAHATVSKHNNAEALKRHLGAVEGIDQDHEALRAENTVLRKRIEDLNGALLTTRVTGKAAMSPEKMSAALEQAAHAEEELKKLVADLNTRIKLLEGALGERTLEQRRLKDELRDRESQITQLQMEVEQLQSNVRTMSAGLGDSRRPSSRLPGSSSSRPSPAQANISVPAAAAPAGSVEELKEYNTTLLKTNSELQKKNAFLTIENAKLTAQINVLEERADDAQNDLETVKKEFDKVRLENEDLRNSLQVQMSKLEKLESDNGAQAQSPNKQQPKPTPPSTQGPPDGRSPKSPQTAAAASGESVEELKAQLKKSNQLNVELTVKNDALSKQVEEKDKKLRSTTATTRNETLQHELTVATEEVKTLREQLAASVKSNEMNRQILEETRQRFNELDGQLNDMAKRKAADPSIVRSIEEKMERIAALEKENAQLARELEEAQGQAAEDQVALRAEKKSRKSSLATAQSVEEDVEKLQKEAKKAQKKLKKAVAERNAMAMDLYEAQLNLARSDRTLQQLAGGVSVAIRLCKPTEGGGSPVVRISEADASRLVLLDCGEEKEYQFDYCCGNEEAPETFFTELRRPIDMAASGFQVGFITLGEMHTGKSTFLKGLLPLFIEHLSQCTAQDAASYTVTYKVAVVDISADGALDCGSATPISRVRRDDHGFVVPEGVTYVDCKSVSVLGVLYKLMKQRVNLAQRSHTWMQVQCVRTHKATLTYTTGRLTVFDLCGTGPIEAQRSDIDSARFANRSFQSIKEVMRGLAESRATVPYDATVETSLLYDLLGGNSLTTVIGAVHPSAEHLEESIRSLGALDYLSKIRNGPLYQDFVSSDHLRWRDAVRALRSDEQAEPELLEVDNIRGSIAAAAAAYDGAV